METHFARLARSKSLTDRQKKLVIGSLLGDGFLVKTTRGFAFRVNHGLAQKFYVDWKYEELKDFVNSRPRQTQNCYYFRTISHPYFDFLRSEFYIGRRKCLPLSFIDDYLDGFLLAVWIMDDGSRDKQQLRINTQCFSKEELEMLRGLLRAKFGLETKLNQDKRYFRIRFSAQSMQMLMGLIRPHILPNMLYKLPL